MNLKLSSEKLTIALVLLAFSFELYVKVFNILLLGEY